MKHVTLGARHAWFILLVSAFTDGGAAAVGGILAIFTAAQVSGHALSWSWPVVAVPIMTGVAVMFRTIQEALKSTAATAPALMGQPVTQVTQTPTETVKSTPTETVVATPARKRKQSP